MLILAGKPYYFNSKFCDFEQFNLEVLLPVIVIILTNWYLSFFTYILILCYYHHWPFFVSVGRWFWSIIFFCTQWYITNNVQYDVQIEPHVCIYILISRTILLLRFYSMILFYISGQLVPQTSYVKVREYYLITYFNGICKLKRYLN